MSNTIVKQKNTLLEDSRYLLGGIAGVILNFFILGAISSIMMTLGFNHENTSIGVNIALTSLSFLLSGVVILYFVNVKFHQNFKCLLTTCKDMIALNWIGPRRLILAAVISPFIYFSSIGVSLLLSNFFEAGNGNNTTNNITSGENSGLLFAIVFVVLLTPIMEEFFFRGVLLGSLLKFSDSLFWRILAIIFVSGVFGLMHIQGPMDSVSNILAFTAPFTLGLVAAILRVSMNSIYPAMAIHIAYNLIVTILMFNF